jgi:ribonucleoside-diphosphate reductase beta chain
VLAGYAHLRSSALRLQWDERAIDLRPDRRPYRELGADRRRRVDRLLAGFWVAERQVAEQLDPFIAAADGELRELLALQAGDERRHARFFGRALREVIEVDPARWAPVTAPADINRLFEHELRSMARALAAGTAAMGDAVALYHLVLEAIVLSTGQDALLEELMALPGLREGVSRVQADERWHVGLGVQALCAGRTHDDPSAWLDPNSAELAALAGRAATAWGPEVATPSRVQHALATHRRRVTLLVPRTQLHN